MRITIFDMDYYYSRKKTDCFNPDAMKISSYHKQKGDFINFVEKEDDINRPADIIYIIKNNNKLPSAPIQLYLDNRVRWWGTANKQRINWRMSDAMLACRPDYLLYPEKNTWKERSEQLRLLGNNKKLLALTQDYTNSFNKYKRTLVTDKELWIADEETIIKALKNLQGIKNVTFLEPIWIEKIASSPKIKQEFFKLNLTPGSDLKWVHIFSNQWECSKQFLIELRENFPHINTGILPIKFYMIGHWYNNHKAIRDFETIKSIIIDAKHNKINVGIVKEEHRLNTPYFALFETISKWTYSNFSISWLEFLTNEYGPGSSNTGNVLFWNHPHQWGEVFRDFLRQTWSDREFLLLQWGNNAVSEVDINWQQWEWTFRLGL